MSFLLLCPHGVTKNEFLCKIVEVQQERMKVAVGSYIVVLMYTCGI